MNKNTFIIVVLLIFIMGGLYIFTTTKPESQEKSIVVNESESVLGCYRATLKQDVYTLALTSKNDNMVTGTLAIHNFEKDSSTGTISGSYIDGILLADYIFNSEGVKSTMQVAFKKTASGFIRGYGETDPSGAHFVSYDGIKYDDNVVFQPSAECSTVQI